MHFLRFCLIAISLKSLSWCAPVAYAGLSRPYQIDLATGAYSVAGSGAYVAGWVSSMDISPVDGKLYGFSGSSLYEIDPATGATTLKANIDTGGSALSDMTFDEEGNIWVSSSSFQVVHRLDANSFTQSNLAHSGSGYLPLPGLAWVNSTLIGAAFTGRDEVSFYSLNTASGARTLISTVNTARPDSGGCSIEYGPSLDVSGTTLYMNLEDRCLRNYFYSVDLTAQTATALGSAGGALNPPFLRGLAILDEAAAIPEPDTTYLCASAVLIAVLIHRLRPGA